MARKTQTPPKSFEDALRELEDILGEIEAGELGLEQSLQKYERGNFLIQHCRGVLNSAEKQIDLLSRAADGGLASTLMAVQPGEENGAVGEADHDEAGAEEAENEE
jgi:exodeoxyribonuclease VII small subunit